jgi:hypothetical protein
MGIMEGLVPEADVEHWTWRCGDGSPPVRIEHAKDGNSYTVTFKSDNNSKTEVSVWWYKSDVQNFIDSLQSIIGPPPDKHVSFPEET